MAKHLIKLVIKVIILTVTSTLFAETMSYEQKTSLVYKMLRKRGRTLSNYNVKSVDVRFFYRNLTYLLPVFGWQGAIDQYWSDGDQDRDHAYIILDKHGESYELSCQLMTEKVEKFNSQRADFVYSYYAHLNMCILIDFGNTSKLDGKLVRFPVKRWVEPI